MVQEFQKIFLHGLHGIIGLQFIIHPLDDPLEFRFDVFIQAVDKIENPVNKLASQPLL